MLNIKVLGPGCANCKRVEQIVRKVLGDLAIEAEVIKVEDHGEILKLGVMNTPGLIINDEIVLSGRLPSQQEVLNWITGAAS
ncbi:MAG: thioredoxin family protein [Chloroflexi bacterium]|nr:MAG: thioredoxin family protein [Chloroflexota bacterium]MBL1193716.1 thioredoxin family protein [Chloroflexota bacterium]NOH11009.1 thioredoxin family protein [Chloroflexota bacterium]